MNKKAFDFSAFAVALIIIAILFSACSSGSDPVDTGENNNDPEIVENDAASEEPVYNENVTFSHLDCFIADDPYVDPSFVESTESYDCIPGYIYFEKEVYGEVRLLYDNKKLRIPDFNDVIDKMYVFTEDNEVVKINKADRSYETVYKAQYGDIYSFSYFDYDYTYMFFTDGDYVVRLNQKTEECKVITKLDEKVELWHGLIGGRDLFPRENFFYCDICGGGDECFVWNDEDYNFYWYHPETGVSEKVDLDDLWWGEPGVDYPDTN